MEAKDIDDIPKLCEWVAENILTEHDLAKFGALINLITREMAAASSENSMMKLEIISGEAIMKDGTQRVAYFIHFVLVDEDKRWGIAILVDEATSKLCEPEWLPNTTPTIEARHQIQ